MKQPSEGVGIEQVGLNKACELFVEVKSMGNSRTAAQKLALARSRI